MHSKQQRRSFENVQFSMNLATKSESRHSPTSNGGCSFKCIDMCTRLLPRSPKGRPMQGGLQRNRPACGAMPETSGDRYQSPQKYLSHKDTTHYSYIIDKFNLQIQWEGCFLFPSLYEPPLAHMLFTNNSGHYLQTAPEKSNTFCQQIGDILAGSTEQPN